MWHLIEDFFEQSLVMKGFIGLGWLCVMVMLISLGSTLITELGKESAADSTDSAAALVRPADELG